MTERKRDFDSAALRWDQDSGRVKLANDVADSILAEVSLEPDMDALDFGCGTGLVTLRLQPYVRSITGVDGSQGMIDILNEKVKKFDLPNVRTRLVQTDAGFVIEGQYNLIVSSMTFHHISDVKSVIVQFAAVALPAGYVCIADLDLEDGRFHDNDAGVAHHGFDRAGLVRMLEDAGFENIRHRTAAMVTRPVPGGGSAEFSVFLITGRRPK